MTAGERNRRLRLTLKIFTPILLVGLCSIYVIQTLLFWNDVDPLLAVCTRGHVNEAAAYSQSKGAHPTIAVSKNNDEWSLDMSYIPRQARASSLAETELVLCVGEEEQVFVERCPYIIERTRERVWVDRYYYRQQVSLVVAKTGQALSRKTLTGKSSGRTCRDVERFGSDDRFKQLNGDPIYSSDIQAWVQPKLIIQ